MKTTLFIEFSKQSARLMLYSSADSTCHYIDITGGYGKKAIPLYLHYLDQNEILIGEEALNYSPELSSVFVSNILVNIEHTTEYIRVLVKRVIDLIPLLIIEGIVLISNESLFNNNQFMFLCSKKLRLKQTMVSVLSYQQAMAGKYLLRNRDVSDYLYFDYLNLYWFQFRPIEDKLSSQMKVVKAPLNNIDTYYQKMLTTLHKSTEIVDKHKIIQLYHSQRATIFQQFQNIKDVNVYSSILFPPMKIVLKSNDFQEYMSKWINEFNETSLKKLKGVIADRPILIAGGYDFIQLIGKLHITDSIPDSYDENLLLDGGFYYMKTEQSDDLFIKETIGITIGVFNEQQFYPLINCDQDLKSEYELDLLLTNNQKEIQLFVKNGDRIESSHKIIIEDSKQYQRMRVYLTINSEKEIDEVSYELRDL